MNDKKERQNQYFENALYHLAAVSNMDKTGKEFDTDNELVKVCLLVAAKMKIDIFEPVKELHNNSKDPLFEIAKALRIRYRQVAMKGEWWKNDNGPLVAFAEEDNRPIALIPVSSSRYEMIDTTNGTTQSVDRNTANLLKPFAYTFYRPFPSRIIKLKELLLLSFSSTPIRDILIIIVMGLAGGLIGMINPVVIGIVLDSIIPQADRLQLIHIGFLLISFVIGKAAFQLTRQIAMVRMEGRMDNFSQAAVWDRLISLPASFFRNFTAGELTMRAMGIGKIRKALSDTTLNTIISGVFTIFNGMLMFMYDVRLSLIGVGLILLAIAVSLLLMYLQIRYERQIGDVNNKISGLVPQIIGGVSKFRVTASENRAFFQWAKLFSRLRKIQFTKELISNVLHTFNTIFPVITTMVIFFLLGIDNHTLSTGQFVAFNASFGIFTTAMLQLSETFLSINMIVPTFEDTKPILETLPEYDEAKEDPGELNGDIEMGHVTFRYDSEGPIILNDISLKIHPGEYVAIVGGSGCGKSTLLRLLLGFEKPETGKVYYSGQDLDSVDIRSIRKQLGVVLQNGQLMSGDIFSNIVGSNPRLTIKDAEEAARMAGLYEDIENMPMGMYTLVAEGASTLSGGQRQRLMIARAIVNKPKILFFDEATSALDNYTQKIVTNSLNNLKATKIVIAHRLSTIIHCDRIIVLNKGQVAEEGTYQELMEKGGIFSELARRQLT